MDCLCCEFGPVENCLLLIAFSSVCFGGMNVAWWRYLLSVALDIMEDSFFYICLVLLVSDLGDVVLHSCNGNIHNPLCGSLPTLHTSLLL